MKMLRYLYAIRNVGSWRTMILILVSGFFIVGVNAQVTSSSSFKSAGSLSPSDARTFKEQARLRMEQYENLVQQLGLAFEKEKSIPFLINKIMDNAFLGEGESVLTNDLSPGYNISENFTAKEYLSNLPLWYPQGVKISFSNLSISDIYFDSERRRYFTKVRLERRLEGKYNHIGELQPVNDTAVFDYYIKLKDEGERVGNIRIYSMTPATDNEAVFEKVRILTTEKSTIVSLEEIQELDQQNTALASELSQVEQELDQLMARYSVVERRQNELLEQRNQLAYERAELMKSRTRIEDSRNALSEEYDRLTKIASKNRLTIRLGVTGNMMINHQGLLEEYNPNGEERNLLWELQGHFMYRLRNIAKVRNPKRVSSLLVKIDGGRLTPMHTAYMLDGNRTANSPDNAAASSYWNAGLGFNIRNMFSFSGGIGRLSHEEIQADGGSEIAGTMFYSGTFALVSPPVARFLYFKAEAKAFIFTNQDIGGTDSFTYYPMIGLGMGLHLK